ncbi:unnamed protein product, partial [marine sediment metagenome]
MSTRASYHQVTTGLNETRWMIIKDRLGRGWYKFRRNPISLVGGVMVLLC